MRTPKALLSIFFIIFSQIFAQPIALNEPLYDFNGALTIQPKLSVENQKQIRQIETDPTTNNSSSIFWESSKPYRKNLRFI